MQNLIKVFAQSTGLDNFFTQHLAERLFFVSHLLVPYHQFVIDVDCVGEFECYKQLNLKMTKRT